MTRVKCWKLLQNFSSIFYWLLMKRQIFVDTSQLAVFIRRVNREMKVTEQFMNVVSLKGRNTGKDIKEGVIKCEKLSTWFEKSYWHCNR